ncbi:MBL fold metallo-hydrolase [Candidatus Rariloculus sp.]|uniref:MBL fold metallo-hydrolase n=1 Tax=Candidatus Rariloculus sp. TaxID=3101265 RepID=UPI003D133399
MMKTIPFVAVAAALLSAPCLAQNPGPERLAEVEIRAERVGDGLHVLYGFGGNIAVSLGEQGGLIVDSQFPELVPKIRAAIRELGGDEINFGINTHWHYDHADGNQRFGPEGVWFISQTDSRERMSVDKFIDPLTRPAFDQPAYPPAALPIVTFDNRMQLHFNGERIDLLHFGPAHTAGDAAVFFRGHNAVHMGDIFTPGGYPYVDSNSGGDLDGMIAFCRAVLAELDEDAIVIPGHGAISTYADLVRFTEMLQSVRDRIAELIAAGASLEQIIAAEPTAAWDDIYGGDKVRFIDRAYSTLSR